MQDSDAGRWRAEAVAMLSEQASLGGTPVPPSEDEPVLPAVLTAPLATTLAAPEPVLQLAADTAALLRELRSLSEDDPAPGAPTDPPVPVPVAAPPVVRVRRGVFRRSRTP